MATTKATATASKAQAKTEETIEAGIAQAQQIAGEIPAMVREATEKAVAQSKEHYETMRKAAEENTAAVEDSVANLSSGLRELNIKALNAAEQNTLAGFDFMKKVFEAKSVSDVFQLQSAFVRDRFEAATSYSKDIQETARKVAEQSAQPIRKNVEKTFQARA